MTVEIDPLISSYQHDTTKPRAADALQTLRKVASLVKPIMRQRGWRVGTLTEFYPPEINLLGLNWNKGQKICLRLRYPGDERQFLPIEEVVDTMLHELCHIVHGPHDEPFHTLWNALRDEHESLLRKGYTGEGFLSTGHKLGGSTTRLPVQEAQRRARAAAEKRRTLTAGSGQKLGGAPVRRGVDIRKVIADAAQRRTTVTKGCASGTERSKGMAEETEKSGTRTEAIDLTNEDEEAIMLAYIDLIQEEEREKYGEDYIAPSKDNPAGSQGGKPQASSALRSPSNPPREMPSRPRPSSTKPSRATPPPPIPKSTKPITAPPPKAEPIDLTDDWTCDICTLVNPSTYLVCDACGTEPPSPPSSRSNSQQPPTATSHQSSKTNPLSKKSALENLRIIEEQAKKVPAKPMGWVCQRCGNFMESQWWTCAACGCMKATS